MAEILMTPEMLEGKAAEVRKLRSDHDDVVRKLTEIVGSLKDVWKGSAQTAYYNKFNELRPTLQRYSVTLGNYADALDLSARETDGTDTSLASKLNSKL